MMDEKSYKEFCKKGDAAQELFVKFMESKGHIFLAGDRNGKTVNVDVIEELVHCGYIPPNTLPTRKKHGPRLFFKKSNYDEGFTMPDELFLMSNGKDNVFFDVKNRTPSTLQESMEKIYDYYEVEKYSGIKTFLAVVIWNSNEKGYDIYVKKIIDIVLENYALTKNDKLNFSLSGFSKINRNAIKP